MAMTWLSLYLLMCYTATTNCKDSIVRKSIQNYPLYTDVLEAISAVRNQWRHYDLPLVWSAELRINATRRAESCDLTKQARGETVCGRFLPDEILDTDVANEEAIRCINETWARAEKSHMEISPDGKYIVGCKHNQPCRNYVQMIDLTATSVGCAAVLCPAAPLGLLCSDNLDCTEPLLLLVCHFSPPTVLHDDSVFEGYFP